MVRPGVLALVVIQKSEIVEAESRVGMVGSQLLLTDFEGSHVQGFGLGVLALAAVEASEIVEAGSRVGMVRLPTAAHKSRGHARTRVRPGRTCPGCCTGERDC